MHSGDYLVGEWRFSPTSGELRRHPGDDAGVRLEPKVADVLGCLLAHPGKVVAKEELIAGVWPDTFVTDSAVFRHVSELRRALGDDARDPCYIETVPKRGYRLVAPVSRLAVPPTNDRAIASPALAQAAPGARRVSRAALALAATLAVVAVAWLWRPAAGPPLPDAAPSPSEPTPSPPPHRGDPVAYRTLEFAELFEDRVDCVSYSKALDLLQQTLARDSRVAPAWANLIDVSVATSVLGCNPTRPSLRRVEEMLATARDNGLDAAHYHRALGHLRLWADWQPGVAAGEFERADELLPPGERSDVGYAATLAAEGRLAVAVAEARRALSIEPIHPGTNWALGMLLYFADRSDEAEAQLLHTLDLYPGFAPAQNLLALVYLRRGDIDAALRTVGTPADVATGDRFATVPALVYATDGDDARATEIRRAWEQRAADGWVPATAMALMYEGLGERELALEWLRRAVAEGDAWAVLLPVDPAFEGLRDRAGFRELLKGTTGTPGGRR
ncbi:MAG: winged helix-turn-helix domain-containing protein [Acidobacteriota bacterium]|jgi:DNA-binding winged helix-turn-helix (wHTH) protein